MARGPRSDRFADAAGSFANFDKNRQIHALFRQIDGLFPSFCDLFEAPFPSPIRPPSLPSRAHPSRIRNISRRTPACAPQMRAGAGKCARGPFWRSDSQGKMMRSARPAPAGGASMRPAGPSSPLSPDGFLTSARFAIPSASWPTPQRRGEAKRISRERDMSLPLKTPSNILPGATA